MTLRITLSSLCALCALCGEPSSAGPPFPPEEVRGALVLAGGGGVPEKARDEFFHLAGGKDGAKIVVIPTASAAADDPAEADGFLKQWKDLGPASVQLLHTSDRKKSDDPAFAKPLTEATAVWLSGGDQTRLTKAYKGTLVEKELHKLLDRGGVIGGTSAGAAVMSDPMIEGGNPDARTGPGFGFLPGVVVDQHFTQRERQPRLRGVLEKNPGYAGLGIDEGTAVVVRGRSVRVFGEGTVTVCWGECPTRPAREDVLKAGDRLDLFQVRRAAAFRAMRPPFPPKDPPAPVVPKGALMIVGGGGETPEMVNRFFELAGGKDALIVVVPTASEQEVVPDDPGDAKYLRRWGATNVKVLHTRDRKKADDPEFSNVLTEVKGVWFGGGRQWRFVDAYEGTLTGKRFREVLDRGGVIGGSSAGASIQSEYMPRGHPLGNTVMAAEGYERGFGYLPGCAVDQHFFARKRLKDMTGLMKLYPNWLGIGIDESTAIVVQGHTAEVIGKSKVAFYDYRKGPPDGETDYTEVPAGGKYDLKERKVLR
jgi:cyanophycinase